MNSQSLVILTMIGFSLHFLLVGSNGVVETVGILINAIQFAFKGADIQTIEM